MTRLSGFVIDQYDDVDGRVMRALHSNPSDIPDFVKTSARLDEGQLMKLADDRFALVLLDQGRKLRKFAMVDKGNVALDVIYLLKQAHLLPAEAVKVAAVNLIEACRHYGLGVPAELEKAADVGKGVSTKSQKPYAKGAKVIQMNFSGTKHTNEASQMPQLGQVEGATDDVAQRTNFNGVQGQNWMTIPAMTAKEKEREKTAGITKTAQPAGTELRTRERGFRYVDVTGWDPNETMQEDHVPPERTLLGDKYPVDGMDQVKTAADYFASRWKEIHPRDRKEFCEKLASRMGELGMAVPEQVDRYASDTYAADVDTHVGSRRALVDEQFHPALNTLLEKRAHVSPSTFAEALNEFDNITNLRWHWDSQVMDPWYSTFGPSLEKMAADDSNWTYNEAGTFIRLKDLEELAWNGRDKVKKLFGEDVADALRNNPKAAFEKQSPRGRLVLARLADADLDVTDYGVSAS